MKAVKFVIVRAVLGLVAIPLVNCGGGGYGGGGGNNPPASLNISVEPDTITLGNSATVRWNSNAGRCQASGAWSGEKPANGDETVTPTDTGDFTYSLVCSGGGYRESQEGSATLTVNPAALAGVWTGKACCDASEAFEIAGITNDAGGFHFIALGTQYVGLAGRPPVAHAACADCLAGARQAKARPFRLLAIVAGKTARPGIQVADPMGRLDILAFSVPYDAAFQRSADLAALQGSYTTHLGSGYTLTVSIDAAGELSGADTNGCSLHGQVSERPTASLFEVTHVVTGCGARDGRYAGEAALLAGKGGQPAGLFLATSNADAAIGWRLAR